MKIEKLIWNNGEYLYAYKNSETTFPKSHGLIHYTKYIGYHYHTVRKGFWLKNKKYL